MPHTVHDYSSLQADIKLWCARNDSDFVTALPEFIHMAEQRIFYGAAEPYKSDPVRVRDMKTTVPLTIVAGAAPLPTDYLEQSSLTYDDDAGRRMTYRPEEEFDSLISLGGLPSVFTIKGTDIFVKPTESTNVILFTYYARYPDLDVPAATNWLLQNTPSVYLRASLIEAFSFTRNPEQRDEAYKSYISAVNGLTMQTRNSLQGVRLSPSVPGVGNLRRVGGF